ncbi:MAG: DUF2178 domain-containing protein [Halobacteriota archaeon]|nr:DUF2178 domain-containing protein [Halobacteriota archaeon]
MKFRMDKDILKIYGMGFGLIIIGILFGLFVPLHFTFIGADSLLVLMGIMTIVIAIYDSTKEKVDILEDERSVRIKEKAGNNALLFLIMSMGLLQFINLIGGLKLTYTDAMPILFILGAYSWIVLRWHYNRKGDL